MTESDSVRIDGAKGEGGGQIVRSSLALSLLTGRPLEIENIRGGRKKPGLMRQHLAAVRAAAEIGQAEVSGDAIGSQSLQFRPQAVQPGAYQFSIGSAGSATLVLQTVLPALLCASGPTTLTIEGGTHNPWAPSFDFIQDCFLPLVNRLGPSVRGELLRSGFYPAGGGQIRFEIEPADSLRGFALNDRGRFLRGWCEARVANLSFGIAEREAKQLQRLAGWPTGHCRGVQVEANGPGNVILVGLEFENLTEMFTGFGRQGVRAEQVARETWRECKSFLQSEAALGPYLADQWMLPLAIAAARGSGGQFITQPLSEHATTHLNLIQRFLPVEVATEPAGDLVCVRIEP